MAVANVDVRVNSGPAVAGLNQVNAASKAATVGVNGLKAAIAPLLGAFAAIQAVKFVFAKTSELETQTKSLQVLTGSAEKAKQIIQELQQLGAVTPFTSTELIDSAKRLQAFGVEADKVVETTKRLADASGATGAELSGLVTAYGQVQAKGRLQGEELLQFQERGIALQEELRKMYGMTGVEFQKALSKGQVSAKAVEVALVNLTSIGGKYANGAIAQSDTLQGRLSTLQDGIDGLARGIGTALSPAIKAILNEAIFAVNTINNLIATGARAKGFGLGDSQRKQILNQAQNEAQQIVEGRRIKDPFERNRQFQELAGQRERDLIESYGYRTGQVKPTATAPQMTAQTPGLLGAAPTGTSKRTGSSKAAKQERESQLADILAVNGLFRSQETIAARIAVAEVDRNTAEVARLQHVERSVRLLHEAAAIHRTNVPLDEKQAQLRGVQDKLVASTNQYEREIATEKIAQTKAATEQLQKMQDEQALLQGRLAGNEAEVMLNQQIRDLKKEFPALDEAAIKTTLQQTEALKQQVEAAEQMKQIYTDIGMTIKSGVVGAIQGAVDGTKSLGKVAADVLNNIANKILDVAVNMALFGAMSGTGTGGGLLGGLFKPRALGGPVSAGSTYMVGERGPELFTPKHGGSIIPNNALGGGTTNVVVNVDASGSSVEGDQAQAKALGSAISAAVQSELVKQKRPGGLLA